MASSTVLLIAEFCQHFLRRKVSVRKFSKIVVDGREIFCNNVGE